MGVGSAVADSSHGWTNTRKAAGVGALGAVIGAFLPWVSFLGVSRMGIDGDGVITLVIGIVVGAAIAWRWTKKTQILSIVGGLLITGVGAYYITEPLTAIGVYVTALAGAVVLAGSVQGLRTNR